MAPDDKKKRSKRDPDNKTKAEDKKTSHTKEPVPSSTASAQMAASPPPPPYSAMVPRVPAYPPQSATNWTSTSAWTRCFICQTDSSYIWLNNEGSQVGYFKGDGPAATSPTKASSARKYFSEDRSTIVLSAEGWIHYDNGAGFSWVWDASQLAWFSYTDRPGFYARPPLPPTQIPTNHQPDKTSNNKHKRHDSGTGKRAGKRGEDSDGDVDDDDYDDMFQFGVH